MSDAQASAVRQAASPEPSVEEWADRLVYVGAEMRGGSDGPSQVVPVAMEFVGPLPPPGARVLLAGPHDDGLAERLAAHGYRVDVQLRAIDDARSTMSRLPASVTVLCGSLTRVHETYDVVVALGGVNHLASADAPVDDLSAALDAFTDRLAPGGLAAIIVRNDLGIDHLTSSGPPGNRADPFSAGRSALAASLSAAGLVVVNEVCLYPDAVAPSVFVRADAFAAAEAIGDDDDAVATVVASAYRSTVLAADTLVDPRRLARESVSHGLGAALAPAWLVVVRHAGGIDGPVAPGDDSGSGMLGNADTIVPGRADMILVDRRPSLAASQRMRLQADGRWLRAQLASGETESTEPNGAAVGPTRRPDRLDGVVPAGPLLEEQMLGYAGSHDMLSLRRLLGAYARWLGVRTSWLAETAATEVPQSMSSELANGPSIGVASDGIPDIECPPDRVFAVADNVVHGAAGFEPLDPSWFANAPVDARTVFLAALVRFAERLLSSALAHPWTTAQPPERLAVRLASMVGLEATGDLVAMATELAAAHATAFDPSAERPAANPENPPMAWTPESARPADSLPALVGPVAPIGPLAEPRSQAAAARSINELQYELAGAREQLSLLAGALRDRDQRLDRANRQLAMLKGSRAFRLAAIASKPAKAAIQAVRRFPGRQRRM